MIKKIIKNIKGIYNDIYKYIYFCPLDLKPIPENKDAWFINNKVVPHALGTVDNLPYTNSKEALEKSLEKGILVLETDVCLTKDSIPVLSHETVSNITFEEFMSTKINGKYTPLSLEDLFNYMRLNEKLHFMLDFKDSNIYILNYAKKHAVDLLDRFIIQVSTKKDYKKVMALHKFKYIHYNFSVDGNLNMNLGFVVRNNIQTCSVSTRNIKNAHSLKYLNKFNVKVFAYTINDKNIAEKLYSYGVDGIITDLLY